MSSKRGSGSIEMSKEMRSVFRLCRAMHSQLELVGERALAQYVMPRGKPEASLAGVEEIEHELGAQIPNDVLVAMISTIPVLQDGSGLLLDTVLDAAEDLEAPDGMVAIGRVSADPFEARFGGAHGGEMFGIYVAIAGLAQETRVTVSGGGEEPQPFAGWLRDQIGSYFRRRDDWLGILSLERHIGDDDTFVPRLAGKPREIPVKAALRRVKHAKFGAGNVAGELEGKLVIEFDDGVKRVLLAKFVSDV